MHIPMTPYANIEFAVVHHDYHLEHPAIVESGLTFDQAVSRMDILRGRSDYVRGEYRIERAVDARKRLLPFNSVSCVRPRGGFAVDKLIAA